VNLFKDLQNLNDSKSRDRVLKLISNGSKLTTNDDDEDDNGKINDKKIQTKSKATTTASSSQYDDDDDVITFNYRMKMKNSNKNAETSESDSQINCFNNDDDDSLSNTVIFVDNKSLNQMKSNENSSDQMKSDEKINQRVKNVISRIIKMLKFNENEEEQEEEEDDITSECSSIDYANPYENIKEKILPRNFEETTKDKRINYKLAKCDGDYLNEIINKVLIALEQEQRIDENNFFYQRDQLNRHLNNVLSFYENKVLLNCIEDILSDISNVLYDEFKRSSNEKNRTMKNEYINDDDDNDDNEDNMTKNVYYFQDTNDEVTYKI
jgi:hypothetical protein